MDRPYPSISSSLFAGCAEVAGFTMLMMVSAVATVMAANRQLMVQVMIFSSLLGVRGSSTGKENAIHTTVTSLRSD